MHLICNPNQNSSNG